MANVAYQPEQIEHALRVLVLNDGNVAASCRELEKNADGPSPTIPTLTRWRDEYSEMYADMEATAAKVKESELVSMLRTRAHRAAEVEEKLLNRLEGIRADKDVPAALRAASDVKAKSIDGLMKLTGREPSGGNSESMEQLVESMAARGYMKLTVNLEKEPPKKIDADATTD
jgi:hypothetical protein